MSGLEMSIAFSTPKGEATLDGLDEMLKELAGQVLVAEMETTIDHAAEVTPHLTGNLRRSKFVNEAKVEGDTISVEAGFSADYALYVHENLGHLHPNGQAKFLEGPLAEDLQGIVDRVGISINKLLTEG